jgi:dihydroorotase
VGIERLVDALTVKPRAIFGLEEAIIEEGAQANLTIFSTEASHTATKDKLKSASQNNPFLGKELKGKVLAIVNNKKHSINK